MSSCPSRADNPSDGISKRIYHSYDELRISNRPERNSPLLISHRSDVRWINYRSVPDGGSVKEINLMLGEIAFPFQLVPFELHRAIIR
jgi:hypothetical protein